MSFALTFFHQLFHFMFIGYHFSHLYNIYSAILNILNITANEITLMVIF